MKVKKQSQVGKIFIRQLLESLGSSTKCTIQHKGCPCNTCFFYFCTNKLRLSREFAYRLWSVILVLRGDYTEEEILNYEKEDEKKKKKGVSK